jgi:DNA topoisomerase-1
MREKEESPKPPFCTATFQQEAASKLNLKVKDAMSIAQKLFEAGRITYMRTDSTDMSKDFLEDLKSYINVNYGNIFTEPRKGKKSGTEQDGHECLRVTDIALTPEDYNKKDKNTLNQKVYKIIWQRTIAACLPNARISETNYNIYNNDQKFVFTSNELIYDGYKQIYKNEEQEEKLAKETFEVDEILQNCELDDIKKQTTPPARFTEASLVAKLKDTGIGRPSTYAGIIDTVLSHTRGYAEIIDKKIVPTLRGTQLSEFLDRSFSNIINLNYTKTMEEQLDLIAENKLDKTNFLNTFYKELVKTIEENTEEVEQEEKICPICGASMQIRRSRFGKLFYGCTQYPNCRGIIGIN